MSFDYKLEEIKAYLVGLSAARRRKVLISLQIADNGDEITLKPGEALYLWIAHLLNRRSQMDQDAQDLILEKFQEQFTSYGDTVQEAIESKAEKMPIGILSIADNRYVSCTGHKSFLNLQKAEFAEGIVVMPLEIVSYNLGRLYTIHLSKLQAGRQKAEERK